MEREMEMEMKVGMQEMKVGMEEVQLVLALEITNLSNPLKTWW